jgi:hypothetical protein
METWEFETKPLNDGFAPGMNDLDQFFLDNRVPKPSAYVGWDNFLQAERDGYEEPFSMPRKHSPWSGCYLGFVEQREPYAPFPLYAGRSVALNVRLNQHANGRSSTFIDSFWDFYLDLVDKCPGYHLPDVEFYIYFAVWFLNDKHQRTIFEHLLISNLHPKFNRA